MSASVSTIPPVGHTARPVTHRPPIRVLFFNHTGAQGGAEIALLNLLRNLDLGQVTPVVVFAADGPIVEKVRQVAQTHVLPLSRSVVDARKDSLGVASLLRLRAVVSAFFYVLALSRFIRQHDIDLVHTNTLKAHLLGAFAARLARHRVVWHMRDRIENDYLPPIVVRLYRYLCRIIPDFIVANSHSTLRSLHLCSSTLRKCTVKSSVIHDGTYCSDQVHSTPRSACPARIALIGRICPWKGQHIFLQAAAVVHRRFPSARFLIVGSALFGEAEYDNQIHQLSDKLGISDIVTFTGFCPNVSAMMDDIDLVVHASTIGEPFGQVIIEAMSAGKPVVATNGGGVPEIVDNERTGILVPMGDAAAMADAICRIIADPQFARGMGERGRDRVRKQFSIERTARNVESVYREIIYGSLHTPILETQA